MANEEADNEARQAGLPDCKGQAAADLEWGDRQAVRAGQGETAVPF